MTVPSASVSVPIPSGRRCSLDEMLPAVYEELTRIAHRQLRTERVGHTLNTGALVHEAYLRLIDVRTVEWRERAHFLAMAARVMRRILIDYARSRGRDKRGGEGIRVSLTVAAEEAMVVTEELTALDDALARLEQRSERQCRIVEYRCFAGLSIEETAVALQISPATTKRELASAREWLDRELRRGGDDSETSRYQRIEDSLKSIRPALEMMPPPDLLEHLRGGLAGRYQIEQEIGRGGTAIVFAGKALPAHSEVALKVLMPGMAHLIGRAQFQAEADLHSKLTHPNILPLIESGEVDGLLFQVFPYLQGGSLRQRLQRGPLIKLRVALGLLKEIGAALQYAHGLGIIHRDIKPENVLFDGAKAILADFGTATFGAVRDAERRKTVLGTPAYMSPEQARGETGIDARSDQYSLACVLYEILMGSPFITGETTKEVLRRNQIEPPVVISKVMMQIPRPVTLALRKALSPDPTLRFDSVADFVQACHRG